MICPDLNALYLSGRLKADPTHRTLPSGLPVANAKIVVRSHFLSTEKAEVTSTLNLVFYGPMAELAGSLSADDYVSIVGELVARQISKTDNRTVTEIIVRNIVRAGQVEPTVAVPADVKTEDPRNWA